MTTRKGIKKSGEYSFTARNGINKKKKYDTESRISWALG